MTKTIDSAGLDEKDEKRSEPFNPLTGPFFVEGAEPGERRGPAEKGSTEPRLGMVRLSPWPLLADTRGVEHVYPNDVHPDLVIKGRSTIVPWDIDRKANTVRLRTPKSQVHPLEFPARPMLGCIGVAPAGDFPPTSGPSGPYGGNLDYNKIGEGATVSFPIYHPGGLLFLGDGHALQADGEPTGTGIETSMDVEFVVELKKKANLTGPRVETSDEIISIGSQPEFASALDNGLKIATSDMAGWLAKDYGMEPWAAHLLIGYQGTYDVVTVAGSMALRLRRTGCRRRPTFPLLRRLRRRRRATPRLRSRRRRKASARSTGSSRCTGTSDRASSGWRSRDLTGNSCIRSRWRAGSGRIRLASTEGSSAGPEW